MSFGPHRGLNYMIEYRVTGAIAPADIPKLCDRIAVLIEANDCEVVVDVGELVHPDAAAIDAVARLQLTAKRLGRPLRFKNASCELAQLLDFCGLCAAVPALVLEPVGQSEKREEVLGVEEEADPGDLPV